MKEINETEKKSDPPVSHVAAIEASMDGIAILNAEGEYIYVNKAHAEVYGYSSQLGLIGRSWKILYDDRELKRFEQGIMPTVFRNGRWRGEAVGKRCDGSHFDQELSLTAIEGGGLVCVVRDVTTRKEAEDALRRSEASLADAQRVAHLGNWCWDIKKDDFRGSAEVARIFGVQQVEFGMTLEAFFNSVHPDDREYVNLRVARTLSEGEPFNIDHRIVLPDCSERFVQLQGKVILDDNGNPAAMSGIVLDITERKKAEGVIEASEKKLKALLDAVNDAIMVVDPQGRILEANSITYQRLGYRRDELLKMTPRAFDTPEYAAKISERLAEVKRNGSAIFETAWITRDGRIIPTEIGARAIEYEGKPAILSVARDVSERKIMVEELRASRQILEGIINAIPVRVFWKDKNLVYLGCNAVFARDAGFADPKDIIGRDDFQMGWRDQAELYRSDDRQVIESGVSKFLMEEPQTTPEGATITLLTSKLPLRTSTGEISGVLGTYMDITELKRSEEAFRSSEKKFRDLLETINLVAIMLDFDGNITFCNDFFLHLTGWTRDEVLNRNWFELFLPKDVRKTVYSMYSSGISDGTIPLHYENPIITREGTLKIIVWNNSMLRNSDGKVAGVASIGTDVTEHRKLEVQLRHSQKMEAVGQLAGGIAHDFNNILSAIIGYGHVTLMKMVKDDPLKYNIEQMLAAADRAAHLTKDLLLFSRKQVSYRSPVDLNRIIRTVEKFLARVSGEDIAFKTILHDGPIPVLADMHQLEQVLMNLAANARDAMPKGGILTIATEQIMLDKEFVSIHGYGNPGMYAMITVADTGIGMDEHTQPEIYLSPSSRQKKWEKALGSGWRLSTALSNSMRAISMCTANPARVRHSGYTCLLLQSEIMEEKKAEKVDYPEIGTETILLAEDDESLRELTVSVLQEFGYKVIVAVDGEDAVKKYIENEDRIQLLLFDIVMPKKTGKEAYDEIKRIKSDMRVIFLSGYAPDIIQQKALLENNEPVAYKPISPVDLLKKIRSMLN